MDYRVTRNVFTGSQTIHYACPKCGTALESNLEDAGDDDTCPECATHFFVPGERELDEELRQQERKDREAEQKRQVEQRKAQPGTEHAERATRERQTAQQLRKRRIAQMIVSSGGICQPHETIGLVVGFASSPNSEAAFKRARERLLESAAAKQADGLIHVQFQSQKSRGQGCVLRNSQVLEVFAWGTAVRWTQND